MSALRRILERAQPGSHGGVRQHTRRGEVLRELIEARWGISRVEQWRAKHLRWVLEVGLADKATSTKYQYFRTARAIAGVLGHWPNWEPHLRGPWTTPDGKPPATGAGGRPPKLAYRGKKESPHRARGARKN